MKENKVEKWYRQMKETMSVIDKVLLMELLRVWMQDQSGQEHRRGGMFDPWSRL